MTKSVEENPTMYKSTIQLFDNPLKRDFVTLDQLKELFGYKKKWFTQRMADGSLPYRQVGRHLILFYVPEVRQAILDGRLAAHRKVIQDDNNRSNKKRNKISSSSEGKGWKTLEDIRDEKRSGEMGQLYPFP